MDAFSESAATPPDAAPQDEAFQDATPQDATFQEETPDDAAFPFTTPGDAACREATPDDAAIDAAPPIDDKLARCEERIGYKFRDRTLLRGALTHASGAEHRLASNERLEFLGDSILGLVVCDALFRRYPEFLEGELTRVKSVVVSRHTCAKISILLGLEEFLIMGKGMQTSPSVPQSLLADVFESLIAAIYLDSPAHDAQDFVKKYVWPEIILAVSGQIGDNYKSQLQQLAQREYGTTPVYQLMDEKGPDHSKCFKVMARLGAREFQAAWGRNKKEAEQRAACNALAQINAAEPPFPSD